MRLQEKDRPGRTIAVKQSWTTNHATTTTVYQCESWFHQMNGGLGDLIDDSPASGYDYAVQTPPRLGEIGISARQVGTKQV